MRLGIAMVLVGLLASAFSMAAMAQATPEAEPTETVEPTVVPTLALEPTLAPTVAPTVAPTTAPEPTAAPASRTSMGIMAAPFEVTVAGPATVRPEDDLTYTMTFTNTAGRTFERVDMSGRLPSGMDWTIVPDRTSAACFVDILADPPNLICSGYGVVDGATATATITARVPAGTSCGTTYSFSGGANGMYSVSPVESTGRIASNTMTTDVICDDPAVPFEVTVAGPATVRPGDDLTYTLTVTNTSGRVMERVDWGGPELPLPDGVDWSVVASPCSVMGTHYVNCHSYHVADGAVLTATLTAQVSEAVDCGASFSTWMGAGGWYSIDPPEPTSAVRSNTVTTQVVCDASIDLAKAGSYVAPTADAPFGAIAWTLTVTNTGDADLTNVTVTDAGVTDLDCDPATPGNQATVASLAPGEANAVTCTASSAVTAADGGTTVSNDASVSATPSGGGDPVTDTATAGVDVPALDGGIAVTKTVTNQPAGGFDFGDTVTYGITVTNTGSVPLFGVTVSDDRVTDLDCGTGATGATVTLARLDPGDANAVTCTASATWPAPTVGAPDAVFENTVDVRAPFGDTTLTDVATAQATLGQIGYSFPVAIAPETVIAPGPVTLTWTLTNTGGVTLHGLGLDASLPVDCDPATGGDQPMPATLASAGVVTCTATLTATQDDIDAGDPLAVSRTLIVFGDEDTVTHSAPIEQQPALTLAKSVDPVAVDALGDVTWAFLVTNTGNVTLTGLALDDPLVDPAALDCDPADGRQPLPDSLATQTSITCTAITAIGQEQLDAREPLTNTARVTSDQATSNDASATLTITPRDGLALVLTADPATLDAPGPVTWTYALANNGTSTLTNLAIDDPALDPATLDCDPAGGVQPLPDALDPGAGVTCTATQVIDQDGIDADDPITREARVTSAETDSNLSRATIGIVQEPGIGLTKTVTSATTELVTGDVVTYELVLTNTGNVTVQNPEIADSGTDTLDCGTATATLAPQATLTCTATYTITDADMLRGSYTNTASASATVGSGGNTSLQNLRQVEPLVVEATDSATVTTVPARVGLTIVKSVDPAGPAAEGTTLTYTFAVANTGNVTLDDVAVTDALPGLVWDNAHPDGAIGELAGGDSVTLAATYKVTPGDIVTGAVVNEAVATGQHPSCREGDDISPVEDCAVTSAPSSVTVETLAPPTPTPTPTPESSSTPETPAAVTQLPTTGAGPGGSGFGLGLLLTTAALALLALAVRSAAPRRQP